MKFLFRHCLAACVALAFAACGGNTTSSEYLAAGGAGSANANDGGTGSLGTSLIDAGSTETSAAAGSPSEGGAGDSGAGAGGEAAELTGGSPSNPSGGNAETAGGGPGVGKAGAGGAPGPVIASGTHLCTGADDCVAPVECRGRASSRLRVCLKSCASDGDCLPSHRCVLPGTPLGPDAAACFLRCEASPLVCPYALDCFDISGHRDYTCLPRQW